MSIIHIGSLPNLLYNLFLFITKTIFLLETVNISSKLLSYIWVFVLIHLDTFGNSFGCTLGTAIVGRLIDKSGKNVVNKAFEGGKLGLN